MRNGWMVCALCVVLTGCMSGGVKQVGHSYLHVDAGTQRWARPGVSMERLIHCQTPIYIKTSVVEVKDEHGKVIDTQTYQGPYCDKPVVVMEHGFGSDPITGKVAQGALIGGGIAAAGYGIGRGGDKTNVQNGSSSNATSASQSRSQSSSMSTAGGMMPRRD
ncbi:MAG: hypothetical protein NPIRA02_10730 [Nitrospirales bacterium]|nr:MAG: hypothetical protein NPIRA02_10730 [Nitrospirales bacterium]